jgi:molecular chaperone GrpE
MTETTENNTENAKAEPEVTNIESLKSEMADLNDKYLRLYAEYDNFRKRTTREKLDYMSTAGADTIKAFIPIADDFERAISANASSPDPGVLADGVQLIFNKLEGVFKSRGVEPVQSAGKAFDPETMEAISSTPASALDMVGRVELEVVKGYTMNGRVIRHAKVIVGAEYIKQE